jgi:hypothetical protein
MKNITINGFNLPIKPKINDPIVKNHNPSNKLSIKRFLFVAIYAELVCDIFLHAYP